MIKMITMTSFMTIIFLSLQIKKVKMIMKKFIVIIFISLTVGGLPSVRFYSS